MTIPSTIFALIGATVAALIAGWISATNLVIAKDQKISEFRQKWIDDLRNATSEMLGHITMLAAEVHFNKEIAEEPDVNIQQCKIQSAMQQYCPTIAIQFTKIRLYLNPIDDKIAIDHLNILEDKLDSVSDYFSNTNLIASLSQNFENSIKDILKAEWERVKIGEPTHQNYKKMAEFLPVLLFILLLITCMILPFIRA